jgi:hypothetical protein
MFRRAYFLLLSAPGAWSHSLGTRNARMLAEQQQPRELAMASEGHCENLVEPNDVHTSVRSLHMPWVGCHGSNLGVCLP